MDLGAGEWQIAPVVEIDREWTEEEDLGGQHLGLRGAIILAALMPHCSRLTSLSVADNSINAEGAIHLAEGITGSRGVHAPLTALDISCNCLTQGSRVLRRRDSMSGCEYALDHRGVEALAAAIGKCRSIVQVTFNGCIATPSSTSPPSVSGDHPTYSDIVTVDTETDSDGAFCGKRLGISGTVLLTSVLPRWGKLLSLDLSCNGLYSEGAHFLMQHGFPQDAPWSTRLVNIDLSDNDLVCDIFLYYDMHSHIYSQADALVTYAI
jgi:hypothetical protein